MVWDLRSNYDLLQVRLKVKLRICIQAYIYSNIKETLNTKHGLFLEPKLS